MKPGSKKLENMLMKLQDSVRDNKPVSVNLNKWYFFLINKIDLSLYNPIGLAEGLGSKKITGLVSKIGGQEVRLKTSENYTYNVPYDIISRIWPANKENKSTFTF